MSLCTGVRRLCFVFNNLNINPSTYKNALKHRGTSLCLSNSKIHTSNVRNDLMEFFDDPENWGEVEVPVGRSWKVEELRIKSNSDLHKLWYVLLKEKNMLLTMEHEYTEKFMAFPSPERIDKVRESMKNLESVVRERNRAYFELETGGTGERHTSMKTNCFGLEYSHKNREYHIPKKSNKKYWEFYNLHNKTNDHFYVKDFLTRLEEKKNRIQHYRNKKHYLAVCKMLRIFPNIDEEALRKYFPNVDIEKAKRDKLSRCHGENQH